MSNDEFKPQDWDEFDATEMEYYLEESRLRDQIATITFQLNHGALAHNAEVLEKVTTKVFEAAEILRELDTTREGPPKYEDSGLDWEDYLVVYGDLLEQDYEQDIISKEGKKLWDN